MPTPHIRVCFVSVTAEWWFPQWRSFVRSPKSSEKKDEYSAIYCLLTWLGFFFCLSYFSAVVVVVDVTLIAFVKNGFIFSIIWTICLLLFQPTQLWHYIAYHHDMYMACAYLLSVWRRFCFFFLVWWHLIASIVLGVRTNLIIMSISLNDDNIVCICRIHDIILSWSSVLRIDILIHMQYNTSAVFDVCKGAQWADVRDDGCCC